LSALADATRDPSGLNLTAETDLEWPSSVRARTKPGDVISCGSGALREGTNVAGAVRACPFVRRPADCLP
jgi:hypothetical protein